MADQRDGGISWTGKTWNPVVGCSIVSPACADHIPTSGRDLHSRASSCLARDGGRPSCHSSSGSVSLRNSFARARASTIARRRVSRWLVPSAGSTNTSSWTLPRRLRPEPSSRTSAGTRTKPSGSRIDALGSISTVTPNQASSSSRSSCLDNMHPRPVRLQKASYEASHQRICLNRGASRTRKANTVGSQGQDRQTGGKLGHSGGAS